MWMNAFVGSYDSSITNKMVKIVVAIAFFPFWLRFSFSGTMKKKTVYVRAVVLSAPYFPVISAHEP